jgi:K+ transporter
MVLGVLADIRDVLIIIWALLSVVALVFIIFAVWTIYSGVKGLINMTKATVNEDVKPILSISQDSVNNVAGTTRFVSDTVAKPVIRGLSFIAGARRALAVFTGLTGRGRSG